MRSHIISPLFALGLYQAHADTGTITYVATSINYSAGFSNGGTMSVLYSPGNDASIDPTAYGSNWPSPFTLTFNVSDVFATDAFSGNPNLIFTGYSTVAGDTVAGLTQAVSEIKIDWQSGMVFNKNLGFDRTQFPNSSFEDDAYAIYSPSISSTYTTDPYTANENFLPTSQYTMSFDTRPTLDVGFAYNNNYSWYVANTGSSQGSDENGDVFEGAKNFTFNESEQWWSSMGENSTVSAEQMFALADGMGNTKTSGFGITNQTYFDPITIMFSSTVPEPSSCLAFLLSCGLFTFRRNR